MRRCVVPAALSGIVLLLAGCAGTNQNFNTLAVQLGVDPEDAAGRAVEGAVLGATLGAALGAAFAINPGVGAYMGTEIGAPLGAAVGIATAEPLPRHATIAVPAEAVIPSFYDSWQPGNLPPPPGTVAPVPPPD
jgi:hypothetical protein